MREWLVAICAVGYFCVALAQPSIGSHWLLPMFLALSCIYLISRKSIGPRAIFWGINIGIGGSALIAIPISYVSGAHPYATIPIAIFTIILAGLYLIDHAGRVLALLVPAALIDVIIMLWQVLALEIRRAPGIALNPNANAAFLGLMAVYLLHSPKYRWLAIPLLLGMPLTGSRWATAVICVLAAIILIRLRAWRLGLVLCAGIAVVLAIHWDTVAHTYRAMDTNGEAVIQVKAQTDALKRITPPKMPWWQVLIPSGLRDSDLHSVPIRMAVETGLLSALTWLGATGYALRRGSFGDSTWWMLLAIGLLSVFYYHTWLMPLGGLWWLLVGMRIKAFHRDALLHLSSASRETAVSSC